MSTRCQIGIYGKEGVTELKNWDALIYRHSDGYPSGVLPDIMPFLAYFDRVRGVDDTEYVSARLLQYMANLYDRQAIEWHAQGGISGLRSPRRDTEIEDTKKYAGTLGHGISKQFHWDIEFYYAISKDGVRVYEVIGFDESKDEMKSKLIGTVPYKDFEKSVDYKKLTTPE